MHFLITSCLIISLALGQFTNELINYSSCRINGTVPNTLSKNDLIKRLGKPTKIEPLRFDEECGLTDEQEHAKQRNWYYYDSTRFFVYDNKADMLELNFRNGKFVYTTDKIKLSNTTTLGDLQKVYPASTKAAIKENKGTMVKISPCPKCDGYCFLYFEKGKLVKLEWWDPC